MASMATSKSLLLQNQQLILATPRRPLAERLSVQTSSFSGLQRIGDGMLSVGKEKKSRAAFALASAVRNLEGSVRETEGLRFAIVVARFNEVVTRLLLQGALEAFNRSKVKDADIDVVWVPGGFEIPITADRLGSSGKYKAIVCIGAVIGGDMTTYDAVANSAASGILSVGLKSGIPCAFAVLTCNDLDQALNFSGGKYGNAGAQAALAAIEMASLFEQLP